LKEKAKVKRQKVEVGYEEEQPSSTMIDEGCSVFTPYFCLLPFDFPKGRALGYWRSD
jgi:hypothetical protein